jgi:hypothetical protein|tara:strand:+ start:214 stop:414 length:201 start_codon:yes stop_codon:yes gene_type:complete
MIKIVTVLIILLLSSCSSIPTCGTKSIKLQLPSAVPFMGNEPFVIERSNDHVDCELDPSERNPNGS